MSFDPAFLDSVSDLYAPVQGTERMAELLYLLVRFLRPRSVLEAGMGYTSPFIAKGLRDNQLSWERERAQVAKKTAAYLADLATYPPEKPTGSAGSGLEAVYGPKSTKLATRRTEWMFEEPTLARPGHYVEPYAPHAYCIDDLSNSTSTAPRVLAKLKEIGLDSFVSVHTGDFWELDPATLPAAARPVDLMWIDLPLSVMNAVSVIEGDHWELLNPNGGMLLIHCMLTNEGGDLLYQEFQRIQRDAETPAFEMLGLIEPHKVVQNNVLMIRKTTGVPQEHIEDLFTAPGESTFEADARKIQG